MLGCRLGWPVALALLFVVACSDNSRTAEDETKMDGGTGSEAGTSDEDSGTGDNDTDAGGGGGTGCTVCDQVDALCDDVRCDCERACVEANTCAERATTCDEVISCAARCVDGGVGDDGGTDAATDGGMGDTVAIEDFPEELAQTYCDAFRDCYTASFVGSDCVSSVTAAFENGSLPRWQEAIGNGTMSYDAEEAASCLMDLQGLGCGLLDERWMSHCTDAFQGTAADGGDCDESFECAGNRVCVYDSSTCPGTCTDRGGIAAECFFDYECESGTYCDFDGVTPGRCRDFASPGESCLGGTEPECEAGSYCAGSDEDTSGTCVDYTDAMTAKSGESCDPSGGTLCESGLSCVVTDPAGTTWQCEESVGADATCAYGFPGQCPEPQYCDFEDSTSGDAGVADAGTDAGIDGGTDAGTDGGTADGGTAGDVDFTNGTCMDRPEDGEPCGNGTTCASGHTCIDGICYEIQENDASCDTGEHDECHSNYCDDSLTCDAVPLCPLEA